MNAIYLRNIFAGLCILVMAVQTSAQDELFELQPGEFESEKLFPFYLPEARFEISSWEPDGYCGTVIVENLPPDPWNVTVTLHSDIVRFGGGSYYGVVNRPHNLVLLPDSIGLSRVHRFPLCVKGRHGLEVHSVNWGKALTYDPVDIEVVAEAMFGANAVRASIEVANTPQDLARIERLVGHALNIAMDRYTVIAVFMGQQGTSGYAVEIPKLVKVPGRPNRLEGQILWTMPASNCIILPAITSPYQIIKISKTDWKPQFVVQRQVAQCPPFDIPIPGDPVLK